MVLHFLQAGVYILIHITLLYANYLIIKCYKIIAKLHLTNNIKQVRKQTITCVV